MIHGGKKKEKIFLVSSTIIKYYVIKATDEDDVLQKLTEDEIIDSFIDSEDFDLQNIELDKSGNWDDELGIQEEDEEDEE